MRIKWKFWFVPAKKIRENTQFSVPGESADLQKHASHCGCDSLGSQHFTPSQTSDLVLQDDASLVMPAWLFFFGRSGLRREKSGKVREKADHFQTRSGCDARLQLPEGQQACKAGWGCDAAIWTYLATLHRQAWSPAHTVGIRLGQIWTFQEYVDLGKEILEYVPELQPEYPRNPKKSDLRNQIPSAKQIRNKRSSKPGKQLLLNWLSRAWSTLERSEQLGTEKFWLLLGNSLACMTCRNWPLLFVCAWHLDSLRILLLAIFLWRTVAAWRMHLDCSHLQPLQANRPDPVTQLHQHSGKGTPRSNWSDVVPEMRLLVTSEVS